MPRTILVLLVGRKESGQTDHYQLLQEEAAAVEAAKAKMTAEIVFAPGFDHLRVLRKRLGEAGLPPLDAVIVEPVNVTATSLILKELKGRTGLVLLNAWSPDVDHHATGWGRGLPFGTVSIDQGRIGQIQGRQIMALLPKGGHVLCVKGPERASATSERLEALKSVVPPEVTVYETAAGGWTESDGIVAFDNWYGLCKTRTFAVDAVAAQSDELAMGAHSAGQAVTNPAHRDMLGKALFLGVDACPAFGRKLVDSGGLAASIATPATTAPAIRSLRRFWESGEPAPQGLHRARAVSLVECRFGHPG